MGPKKVQAPAPAAGAAAAVPAPTPIVLHPKPQNFKAQLTEGATSILNNGKIYEFQMDARDFGSGDVTLTITGSNVRIDAFKETEEEESEISFDVELPPGVDPALLEAAMNKKGVLRLSALITLALPPSEAKTIVVRSEKKTETVVKRTETVEHIVETHYFDVDPVNLDPKFEDATGGLVKSDSGNGFKVDFDLPAGVTKDDITVNVYPTVATVQVKPKEDAKAEPGKLVVEICKKVALPKQTAKKNITSVLNIENGRFTITGLLKAPKEKKPVEPEEVFKVTRVPAPTPPAPAAAPMKVGAPLPVVLDTGAALDVEDAKAGLDVSDDVMKTFDVNGKRFETKVDISGVDAREVEVKALKKVVTVRSVKRVNTMTEGYSQTLFKLFKIPPRVRQEDLEAIFSADNEIKIGAVLQPLATITPKVLTDDTTKVVAVDDKRSRLAASEFKHVLDLTGYSPEQIEVSIQNGWIRIKAKQVKGVGFDFGHNFQARAYSRKFTIPAGLNPADIKVAFDPLTNSLFISA